jgi:hypothetical protein
VAVGCAFWVARWLEKVGSDEQAATDEKKTPQILADKPATP